MKRYKTQGIILARTTYGEADRIITFLTPKHGKIRVMAKGVRKSKSKLAGGIELFSVSDLLILPGKSEIDTLMSARLSKHYGNIVKDLDRTNAAYDFIKLVNKTIEDDSESGYFDVLHQAFIGLNNPQVSIPIIDTWFSLQILSLSGHPPNLKTTPDGSRLPGDKLFNFDYENMGFVPSPRAKYNANDIKFLRVASTAAHPQILNRVENAYNLTAKNQPLVRSILHTYVRI